MRWLMGLSLVILVSCGASSPIKSTMQVVQAFQTAGLEAASPRPMENKDYGMAPKLPDEATIFALPSLGSASDGRVMHFTSKADLDKMSSFYEELERSSATFSSYRYERDLYLVLIFSHDMPASQAKRYGDVLQGIR